MKNPFINKAPSRTGILLLAYVAFISLGLPDGLLGVGWPSIRASFALPLDALGILLIATMVGYLASSFLSGLLVSRLGVGRLLAISCALTGAGLIGYTLAPAWWVMVCLGMIAGLGAGAIDAGLNTYVAANFGEGLMQWLHASFGIGVTLGPVIMTSGLSFFSTWRFGYTVVGVAQIALAVCFLFTLPLLMIRDSASVSASEQHLPHDKTPLLETMRQPRVWLSLFMFFLYTGAEVSLGAWSYTLLTESRGVPQNIAGFVAGSYWASFTIGRFLAGLYTKHVSMSNIILVSLVGAIGGAILVWWNPTEAVSVTGIALIGFAIAPIFPGLVSGTRRRVGSRFTVNTIGMQIGAAGLGGALVPGLLGVMANRSSLEIIPASLFFLFSLILALFLFSSRIKARHEPQNNP